MVERLGNHIFYLTNIISNTILILDDYINITLRLGKGEYEKLGEYPGERRF